MDISHGDFNALRSKISNCIEILEWQMPSEFPTLNRVFENLNKVESILNSYLDDDPAVANRGDPIQLDLFSDDDNPEEY